MSYKQWLSVTVLKSLNEENFSTTRYEHANTNG